MEKKARRTILTMALALAFCATAHAATKTATVDGVLWRYKVSGNAATVVQDILGGYSGDVTIPAKLGGYPVKEIGEATFACCHDLVSVTIPASVTTIGNYAFYSSELRSVTIPRNVTKIGNGAFECCYSLESVTIAGNVARYVDATVSGAHVNLTQSDELNDENAGEITYTLSGNSSDGEFFMNGSYKASIELNGLSLTNPTGAAINIQNGKRIEMSVKKDTENTLTDGADGAQKSALYCKGHLEFVGKGTLNVYGNTAHAIKSAEYMQLKNATINVKKAVKDGISCDEYFLMESGTLSVSGVGDDAIQCDIDGDVSTGEIADHEGEDSGNIYIEGGTLSLTTTGAGTKCIKAGGAAIVRDGAITLNASGGVDTSDSSDPSYVTGIRAEKFVQNGGSI